MNKTNKVAWFVFGFLAIGVGLYPLMYVFADGEIGLRLSKSEELLANLAWNIGFFGHICLGGLALMVGWVQFSKRFRNANLKRHRTIGKIYVGAVLISGLCGVGIAFYATGGLIAQAGFLSLGIVWLYFTLMAYRAIRARDIDKHRVFMIYSYAACFAAVTLRIWLPLLTIAFGSFIPAYRVVAWLCWVPNMVFAYFWVRRKGLTLG
ncbi:DUF2306 domain-containing protein [Maribacter aestuarii]|uniref:DUF2306 domain-containing protein n=1 Tax=Maribacter aestuarii TaxID=1130723 RepID=UPI00248AAFD1|nr:DUF2306 domain-containing protein [Maribacter aestuarii]